MQVSAWTGCQGAYYNACLTASCLLFFTRSLTHPILQAGESRARQQSRAYAVHEATKNPRCAILQAGGPRTIRLGGRGALKRVLDLARAHGPKAIILLPNRAATGTSVRCLQPGAAGGQSSLYCAEAAGGPHRLLMDLMSTAEWLG